MDGFFRFHAACGNFSARGYFFLACRCGLGYNQVQPDDGGFTLKKVLIYTDGACSGNPGPGGWGAVLTYGTSRKEMSGGEAETTNNRMELTAVIEALSALKEPCEVDLTSDSKYVVDAIEKGWLVGWRRRGWKKSNGDPVLNVDLWEKLLPLLKIHRVRFLWIRGHNGHAENERCDQLAVAFAKTFQR